jgi:hypothetical protein
MTKRFMIGDQVNYIGERFAEKLAGRLGVIHARVGRTEHGVVVDFHGEKGTDSYVMDETYHLAPYNPNLKPKEKRDERKDVKVERRRPRKSEEDAD